MPDFIHTVRPPVFRHIQDDETSHCGRACAQMIISALTQNASPATDEIVTQEALREREQDPDDNSGNGWFTHPDELHHLLRSSQELKAVGRTNWRIAEHRAADAGKRLIADVVLTLKREGTPAAITWNSNDHWVLIVGARFDARLGMLLEVLDPLDTDRPAQPHRVRDSCGMKDGGLTIALPPQLLDGVTVSRRSLTISARRNPPNLKNYAGAAVGVLFGRKPTAAEVTRAVTQFFPPAAGRPREERAARPLSIAEDRVAQLRRAAEIWDLSPLRAFLARNPRVVATRRVAQLNADEVLYDLAAFWVDGASAEDPGQGLMAVFAPDSGEPLEFRFAGSRRVVDALERFPEELLRSTMASTTPLVSLYAPLVRRARTDEYVRLHDETPVTLLE